MGISRKPFKMHLYQLSVGDKSLPFEEMLKLTLSINLKDRERNIGAQPYRLEDAHPPTEKNPYWLLDVSKRRHEGGPGKSSRNTPVESFEMGAGFGFAEETAVLYDPNSNYVVVQYNHHGPRAAAIADYFSIFDLEQPNQYELLLQLSPDAQVRLKNKKIFTRLKLKVAPAKLSNAFKKSNVSLVSALSAQTQEFGGDIVTIEVGVDREKKGGSLNLGNKINALLRLATDEGDAVSSMVITGRDGIDHPIDPVDLIHEKLETQLKNMPLDSGLRYPVAERYRALARAYNGWKSEKIIS